MASRVAKSPERAAELRSLFGCSMLGTFNIAVDEIPPTSGVRCVRVGKQEHAYRLVKLTRPDGKTVYGWEFRWRKVGLPEPPRTVLEVYSKRAIPKAFTKGEFVVEWPELWEKQERIATWAEGQYWFQGHPWLPRQRADSTLIWDRMNGTMDWEGKSVLDFGCHTGFYSFEASKQGAVVAGVDSNPERIEQAVAINDHIERQDVQFRVGDTLADESGGDVVLHLSVYHQIDPTYSGLAAFIETLKSKASEVAFVELINPPLKGRLTEAEVDAIVGGTKLLHYKHKVRRMRTLYRLGREGQP